MNKPITDPAIVLSETYITGNTNNAGGSGVVWPAIIGGAFACAGVVLILAPFGTALGFAWSSPWGRGGLDETFTVMGAIWLIVVQWLASGFGGYLTGRLRTKWPGAHTHEVFFRDTVHGLLSWALASVIAVLLLATMAFHAATQPMAHNDSPVESLGYDLFRGSPVPATVNDEDRLESRHILEKGLMNGQISDEDRNYLAGLIVARTGVPVVGAEARIDNALLEEKTMARNASKASFFIGFSLLMGAFIASVAGALGGMHRDVHYETGRLSLPS